MRFIFYGLLSLAAFVLIAALFVGFAFKLAGLGLLAILVVGGVTFVMDRIRGPNRPRGTLNLDRPVPRNTMRFDHSHRGEHWPR